MVLQPLRRATGSHEQRSGCRCLRPPAEIIDDGGLNEIAARHITGARVDEVMTAIPPHSLERRRGRDRAALDPGLELELGDLAVAIDGEVHQDAAYELLSPLSEIYFVPRIAGGEKG